MGARPVASGLVSPLNVLDGHHLTADIARPLTFGVGLMVLRPHVYDAACATRLAASRSAARHTLTTHVVRLLGGRAFALPN